MAISGAGRGTIVRDSGPGSAHGVPCAGATRHSTRRRSRSAAARFIPQTARNRRPDRLRLAARGETRARTIARRRQNRAAMPPRHHCAASRSTSACPWAVGHFMCPRSSLKDAKMEACLGDAEAHSMLRLLHGEGMGHVASRRLGFCHIDAAGRARCCVLAAVAMRHRQSNTAT